MRSDDWLYKITLLKTFSFTLQWEFHLIYIDHYIKLSISLISQLFLELQNVIDNTTKGVKVVHTIQDKAEVD